MRNYWALVLANVGGRLLGIPYSYWLAPYRPRITLKAWRELFNFSKWLFLGNVGFIFDLQMMNFVVGHYLGLPSVGVYQVANQIAVLPISEIAAPIRQPIYAGFSKIFHDIPQLRHQFMKGLEMQCVIIVPLSVGIALTAPEITAVFLGQKWEAVTSLLPIIAMYGLLDAIGHYTHNVFIVLNRQRLYTLTYYAALAVRIPLTVWATLHDGIRGAALAMLFTAGVNAVLWMVQAGPLLHLRWRLVLSATWRALAAAAVMGIVVRSAAAAMGPPATAGGEPYLLLRFIAEVGAGGVAYTASLLAFWLLSGSPAETAEGHLVTGLRGLLASRQIPVPFRRRVV